MDLIPLDATLVKGSHGRIPEDQADWPVFIGDFSDLPDDAPVRAEDVYGHLLRHCSEGHGYARADL